MPQIFHPSFNTISRVSLVAAILFVAVVGWGWYSFTTSHYMHRTEMPIDQPVQFSHQHHVTILGIDCRYCHTSVNKSSFAGIPPTYTCMTCHSQIWADSPMLAPVRESLVTGIPLHWTRVYDLPDFVYFDHSIHIHAGIGCVSCHGQVDQMPLTWVAESPWMSWCLDCHREPERFVRPRSEVYNMTYAPPANQTELGLQLVKAYDIQSRTDCSTCHR